MCRSYAQDVPPVGSTCSEDSLYSFETTVGEFWAMSVDVERVTEYDMFSNGSILRYSFKVMLGLVMNIMLTYLLRAKNLRRGGKIIEEDRILSRTWRRIL